LHLKGFEAMGAQIEKGHGYVDLKAKKLKGAKIYLDFPSVGATENIILAAVLAEGETIIENAAAEPEIIDLADFLNKQGAKIDGCGSDTIKITGVKELIPTTHKIIPDRIEAGTFMTAFAMTRGSGTIKNIDYEHIKPVAAKLKDMGVEITEGALGEININAKKELKPSDIKTLPFPGFPTDMQAPFSVLLSSIEGTGIIVETVFENRFLHIGELNRMGAGIRIDGRASVIEGAKQLSGTKVTAFDLRGGAALVLAGLLANGNTEISGIEHIERGYENFIPKLKQLGAKIRIK
jgi:UDP-N-acetylglucosamine 1-carboxyvinyltransferase